MDDRLTRAKQYLAIAESKDAKREAYKAAAREIAAYRDESPRAWRQTAASYCNTSLPTIDKLVKWADSGFVAETPFLMDDKATTRAGVSHTKKVLREQPVDEIEEMLDDLSDEAVEKIAEATERTKVSRKLYPDRPKPSHKKAKQRAKAKDTANLRENSWEANARLGVVIGSARASVRAVVRQYEEFLAIVEDEEHREDGRERLVTLRADVDLALGEVLEGSIEQAFARLLTEEVG